MSNKRGQLNCAENTKNVGFKSCFLDWKQIAGAFIYKSPRTFTDAEIADLQGTLEADAKIDAKARRVYPVHDFRTPTDNSESLVIETFDYGSKTPVRDGDNDWTFQFVDGGACLNNAGRSLNGKAYVLFYDKENKIMGWNKSTGFSTIPLQFVYFHPFKLATGSKTSAYMVQFVMLAKFTNEEVDFVKPDFDPIEIEGLQDIDIKLNSFNQDTGVANVTLQISCGAENVYDLYHAQIVAASFTASDDDGNAVAVSNVAPVAGNKTFNITLATADLPDDGVVTLSGVAVSVLEGQGIVGYEIGSVQLEVVGS